MLRFGRCIDEMEVECRFFATFRDVFGYSQKVVEVADGSDVRAVLDLICDSKERHGEIFEGDNTPRRYVKVLLNGRDILFLNGTETKLANHDVVSLFPPIGGG